MVSDPSPPPRAGLSLYANLLDPSNKAPGTISSAPVTYSRPAESSPEQDEAARKQQALAASLRFQPTKRPQLAAQKAKAKAIASKLSQIPKPDIPPTPTAVPNNQDRSVEKSTLPPMTSLKSTAADWIATASDDEDVNNFYAGSRQRGGRKKRKKNKESADVVHDWDDIYDPSRPNTYEQYKDSEEKIREVREWKDLLYRHRMQAKESSEYDSDRSERKPMNKQFAPPPSMSFAPPKSFDDDSSPTPSPPPPAQDEPYIPPPETAVPNDPTGEDAYARRMRLSQIPPPPPPAPPVDIETPVLPPASSQISRAPVRYNLSLPPADIPSTEAELEDQLASEEAASTPEDIVDQPRSKRPGQAGFAERLMSKYGWSKGQGLGKDNSGVTSALYAKMDKRKKKSDAEGGGFVAPAATGRILGGTKSKTSAQQDEGKFGAMSEVIRLAGMLKGMDVEAELTGATGEGSGIMQEIGEECGEKYGSVERVYIHTETENESGALVFVQFTSQLSALRAVNALEGRIFSGNEIRARFWDREKFDDKVYE